MIEPTELYNLLNQEKFYPRLSDPVYMLLLGIRFTSLLNLYLEYLRPEQYYFNLSMKRMTVCSRVTSWGLRPDTSVLLNAARVIYAVEVRHYRLSHDRPNFFCAGLTWVMQFVNETLWFTVRILIQPPGYNSLKWVNKINEALLYLRLQRVHACNVLLCV